MMGWVGAQRGPWPPATSAGRGAWPARQRPFARCWQLRALPAAASAPRGSSGTDEHRLRRSAPVAAVEAVLFVAREPLASGKIAECANLPDGIAARKCIRELNRLYDGGGCAFRVEEVAGGYQLMSRAEFGPWVRRLLQKPATVRLSPPAMETLAVIAYRQPVLRAEIESVRGVQCGDLLRQLMDRELVRIVGRSEELGRPLLYGTTKRFLQVFGLRHLDELPRAEALRQRNGDADGGAARGNTPGSAQSSASAPAGADVEEEC